MRARSVQHQAIEACIGTELAVRFCTIFGSRKLNRWIPKKAKDTHPIARAVGMDAMSKLSKRFGGEYLVVPTLNAFREEVRNDYIREMLGAGYSLQEIAAEVGMRADRVRQILRWAKARGIEAPAARIASIHRATHACTSREALEFFALFGPAPTLRTAMRERDGVATSPH